MKGALITALAVAALTALATLAICLLYDGGGVGVPGAVPILVGNAGLVGFVAGLIAGANAKSSS